MSTCSACHRQASINVHTYDLCAEHGRGMVTSVLMGDYTPVGYIIAAACGQLPSVPVRVSAQKHDAKVSPIMRHGALPALPQPSGTSSRSSKPEPVKAHVYAEHRVVRVTSPIWRGER